MAREVSRRQLLGQAGAAAAGIAGLSAAGCSSHSASAKSAAGGTVVPDSIVDGGYRRFITRPDLNPPVIQLARKAQGSQAKYIFLNAPVSGPKRGGAMILDADGDLIWMGPDVPGAHKLDFSVQTYQGKPALTWFEGVETHGWGQGVAVVADSSYRRLHTIRAHHGLSVDHHEFNVTPQNTALVTAYRTHNNVDLRPVGGPAHGVMVSGVCQEIDIASGKLISEWDSLDFVPIRDTYQPFNYNGQKFGIASNPYDYFHINSLVVAPDGNLLISSRNTWCLYKVHRHTGKIIWRLNGKKSDFTMGPGARFYFQHHIRPHPDDIYTVFDNGASPQEEKQSRALVLRVDEDKMHVSLVHQYVHPDKPLLAAAMGSAQLLPGGNIMVGWGTNPYFSEFTADGKLVIAGKMTNGNPSYRTFTYDWTGNPTDRPDVVARHRSGGATVYASWNGSTDVGSWTILGGKSRSSLAVVGRGHRAGFETAIAVHSSGPFFAVQAKDANAHLLATSETVKIS